MADIRANFIAGRMNKSVDERLVPLGEYVDALNVRLGSTETTEIGAVENSKGNTQVTFLAFDGTALDPATTSCLGVYEDGMEETIYWFVHDSDNPASPTGKVDMVVSFNSNSNVVTYHVISIQNDDPGSGKTTLNFNPKYLVTGVSKIENQLFFTDDFNPPRYINVHRNYPDPVGAIDGIKEEDISVIVKPPGFEDPSMTYTPLPVPKVTPTVFPGDENYMETRFLCFAYRYRYQDGGYSATSLFSQPSFQPGPFKFDLSTFTNEGMKNRYNGATIEFSTGSRLVTEIDLLYKESGSNVVYIIERYNKADLGWADENQQTLNFSNSKIYTTLGSDELLRQYDNVPRVAKAQTIQGNRLIYGNYIDGYDITNANGQKIPINYRTDPIYKEITGIELPAPVSGSGIAYNIGQPGGAVTVDDCQLTFDLSDVETPIEPGFTISFDAVIQSAPSSQVTGGDNPIVDGPDTDDTFQQTSPFSVNWQFTAATTYATIGDMTSSAAFQDRVASTFPPAQDIIPVNNSGDGGTATDKFNRHIIAPPTTTLEFINSSVDSGCTTPGPAATAVCTPQGFKYTGTGTGFSIQVPAVRFYSTNGPSEQFEFFNFIDYSSTAGYLLTADTYSLHSNRDYETGIVYMDDYGRASTVLVSNNNTVYIKPENSRDKNEIQVVLQNLPPYWATKYKFVVKPSEGNYFTVFSALYYEDAADSSVFWFKLEGDNTNIVTTGMNLRVKADTNGPMSTNVTCKVLDVRAFSTDDDDLTGINPAGLYMCIKPADFNTELDENAIINYGNKSDKSNTKDCWLSNSYYLNVNSTDYPYDLPAGSSIRVKIDNWRGSKGNSCSTKHYRFDETFTASQDYPNFLKWWYGDGADFTTGSKNGITPKQYLNNGDPYSTADSLSEQCFVTKMYVYGNDDPATGDIRFRNRCGIPRCGPVYDKRPGHVGTHIEVIRGGALIIWETEPDEVDPNLFYDASQMYNIYTDPIDGVRYHEAGVALGDVSQDATNNLKVTLNFANCFTFGNGVESFRISDSPGTKYFSLGQRTLAVSNQDYKEADRFAGMTYSGVFSGAANSNNLNEFNLGLVNYKDCEPSFGPIQILHSRETDILCLQEDRISYVLASKNVITDSTGGGAIASVPEVLGTQIARIEEYGISFNPESFVAWGSDMFFTDSKRGAVINLRGTSRNNDQIQVISQFGMRSWFRDQFAEQLLTQKLGGFDPYMNEYVLSTNTNEIPFPIIGTPCGTTVSQNNTSNVLTYTVNIGDAVGEIEVDYIITTGVVDIEIVWGAVTVNEVGVSASGSTTVDKTANTPNDLTITITPDDVPTNGPATYDITVQCPTTLSVTIIRIVLNSQSSAGEFIHFEYEWTDGATISPQLNSLASLGTSTPSEYISQTGVRSVGMFPYASPTTVITMKALKQGFDDFVFDPLSDRFLLLSSDTLYADTPADMDLLLADPDLEVLGPISGAPGSEQATFTLTAGAFPQANDYLYLVWDLREITSSQLCFSTTSATDACCGCNTGCATTYFGPAQSNAAFVCNTDTNSPGNQVGSFSGSAVLGLIPEIGEICFANTTCDPGQLMPPGFYIVDPNQPATTKNWVEVGTNGIVVGAGTC